MESYLGFGNERLSRDGEAVFDGAVALRHDGQATPLPAPRARRQPLRERKSLGRNHRSVIATQRPSISHSSSFAQNVYSTDHFH